MTERLHYNEALIKPYASLNPIDLLYTLSRRRDVTLGKFKTNLLIRYLPNVSTQTAGSVAFAAAPTPYSTIQSIAALQPSYSGPVWKPATLNVPKALLNTQSWLAADSKSFYLAAAGFQGTFTITVTLSLTTETVVRSPMYDLTFLDLNAYVGPKLEGFSLSCFGPSNVVTWEGGGAILNVDLTRGVANAVYAPKGFATPDAKPYVAILFSFGSKYDLTYNRNNTSYNWGDFLVDYNTMTTPRGGISPYQRAAWRPIHGSTSWWAEVDTRGYAVTPDSGPAIHSYHSFGILILYYAYPGVDVFSPSFNPAMLARPGKPLPDPPGNIEPDDVIRLTPLRATTQVLWSPYWIPELNEQLVAQFKQAKKALLDWPVVKPEPH